MIVWFGKINLGNFDLSFQLSAQCLPFLIELNASWTVAFIEIDQIGVSGFEEVSLPTWSIKEDSVALFSKFKLTLPLFFSSFLLLLLELLESL